MRKQGADTMVASPGDDQIIGFNAAESDRVDFADPAAESISDVRGTLERAVRAPMVGCSRAKLRSLPNSCARSERDGSRRFALTDPGAGVPPPTHD
jgi:hypothetical protein